jgi:glycosyltransferase involved in cell wall biosynthesis
MTVGAPSLVGFEATALELRQRSGVSHYTAQLLNALVKRGGQWRFALLTSRPPAGPIPEDILIPDGWRFPNRSLWVQFALPRMVARLKPQICHFTNSIAPLSLSCPFAVTLYDMSLFLFPKLQPRKSLWLVRSILPAVARKAAAVITISYSAKRDIIQVLKLPPEKVHVIHGAAAEAFHRIDDSKALESVRRKYHIDDPFILAVSTLEPRKNLSRLVAAFCNLRRRGRHEQLVLVGQFGWRFGPLLKQIEASGYRDAIRILNYVPSEDLPAIYNLARLVALPSLYEGFGLPIVEAMACGIPVLTSRRSAMAEVGEGAALLVDPLQNEEIEEGLYRLLTDDSLREELSAAGLKRAMSFSWDRAAEDTLAVYEKIAG